MSRFIFAYIFHFMCAALRPRSSCFNAMGWLNDYINNPPLRLCEGKLNTFDSAPGSPPTNAGDGDWCLSDDPQQKRSKYSQGAQDAVLTSIFDQRYLGTTAKQFVEFGFPDTTFETSYGNGHHLRQYLGFKEALLLDGSQENESIHLHKRFVKYENIVDIFDEFEVPKEVDYVSIDIDSCDVWVFYALTKKYRPRLLTVEYNPRYHIGDYTAMKCRDPAQYQFKNDDLMGSGLSAIELAARARGYSLVYVEPKLDLFFVRNDLLCDGTAPPIEQFANSTGFHMWWPYRGRYGDADELRTDFKKWVDQHPGS